MSWEQELADQRGQGGFLQQQPVSCQPQGMWLCSALRNHSGERAGCVRVCFGDDQHQSRAKACPPHSVLLVKSLGINYTLLVVRHQVSLPALVRLRKRTAVFGM